LFLASISAGFIATAATSADLGSVDAPQPLPPQSAVADIIHDWSGGYVGVVGGGAAGEVETETGSGTLFSETPLRGGLAGVAAGYNVQTGNMVYGVVRASRRRPAATNSVGREPRAPASASQWIARCFT
jgi:outer membrane immunogenic protein